MDKLTYISKPKHDVSLDIIRILACFFIIGSHAPWVISPQNYSGNIGMFLGCWNFVAEPGVGLFLMISGYLLLPVRINTKEFFSKRFGRVLIPTLIWTLIYLFISFFKGNIDGTQLVHALISIPFSAQGHPILCINRIVFISTDY